MPLEIIICIVAGCAVAIFAAGDTKWGIFTKKKDDSEDS
jgi:hypothetical protein